MPRLAGTFRFWSRIALEGSCWVWTGPLDRDGYGRFSIDKNHKERAHRFAWLDLVGDIEAGLVLDHLCRNRRCVNPDHLEPVTPYQNLMRGYSNQRFNAEKKVCLRGHQFVRITSRGQRYCLECARDRSKQYRDRKKVMAYSGI